MQVIELEAFHQCVCSENLEFMKDLCATQYTSVYLLSSV